MPKKVVILGASGFVGGWLLKRFLSDSPYTAVGYSSADCNLLSPGSIRKALSSVTSEDVIVMLSCITRLRENSFESMLKNIKMADNIACFVESHPVSHFIYFNTVDVYGLIPEGTVISESLPPNPHDYYSISKLTSEFILKKALSEKNIPFLSLRFSGIYCPGDEGKSTINALLYSLFDTGKITIFGDGKSTRDFVYVDDAYRIVEEAVKRPLNATVNVATGKSYSILEVIETIKSLIDKKFTIEFKPIDSKAEKRQGNMVHDISLFQKLFPNFVFTSLKAGLSRNIKHITSITSITSKKD
ncbi:NAD(P)-dependent oxidoreductase [Candidatus Woesearchaeota archaeon]|nr:NAD(P)-dependent oxidoreductase [Candidatus Woesearchaeota archaeon]